MSPADGQILLRGSYGRVFDVLPPRAAGGLDPLLDLGQHSGGGLVDFVFGQAPMRGEADSPGAGVDDDALGEQRCLDLFRAVAFQGDDPAAPLRVAGGKGSDARRLAEFQDPAGETAQALSLINITEPKRRSIISDCVVWV
jgi:hypothetical protein